MLNTSRRAWLGDGISLEPQSQAVPYVWHWRDLRPQAMRAAELVGTQQAERRVLRLTNPELPGIASNTLVANIQIVMPGEIARAHRHSGAALRLIIEGQGGYTVVNGERVPMSPGDLVLTPNWSWHDHANDTDAPMIWLDGLDTPLVRMLEAGFYEEYHQERQELAPLGNASEWHYPMSEMRAALDRRGRRGPRAGGCTAQTDKESNPENTPRRPGVPDDRLPHAAAALGREDAGAPPCLLHELSRGRGRRLLGGGGPAARLG